MISQGRKYSLSLTSMSYVMPCSADSKIDLAFQSEIYVILKPDTLKDNQSIYGVIICYKTLELASEIFDGLDLRACFTPHAQEPPSSPTVSTASNSSVAFCLFAGLLSIPSLIDFSPHYLWTCIDSEPYGFRA